MSQDPFGRELPSDWSYDAWPSGAPYDWSPAVRGDSVWDKFDFHLDLGCGRLKKGRIGIDHADGMGVDLVFDLDRFVFPHPGRRGEGSSNHSLPIPTASIESIVSHHSLEHIGDGFLRLMDECYRILIPGGIFRIIVPLFPAHNAVADPDHKRYFAEGTFEAFCGKPGEVFWSDGFAEPYTEARFSLEDKDMSPPSPVQDMFSEKDNRELRVALVAQK